MKRLLIATDGSATSSAAVDEGIDLARELDAQILFVYVKTPPSDLLGSPFYQRRLTHAGSEARRAVDAAMEKAFVEDVDADWEILQGDPAAEILALARERDADLIVVGSRGLGGVTGALLGSVSNRVVHEADRPVLIARVRVRRRVLAVA